MRQYRLIGYDAKNQQLFDKTIEAHNRAVAQMMLLAQLLRNFATVQLADQLDRLVVSRENVKTDE